MGIYSGILFCHCGLPDGHCNLHPVGIHSGHLYLHLSWASTVGISTSTYCGHPQWHPFLPLWASRWALFPPSCGHPQWVSTSTYRGHPHWHSYSIDVGIVRIFLYVNSIGFTSVLQIGLTPSILATLFINCSWVYTISCPTGQLRPSAGAQCRHTTRCNAGGTCPAESVGPLPATPPKVGCNTGGSIALCNRSITCHAILTLCHCRCTVTCSLLSSL